MAVPSAAALPVVVYDPTTPPPPSETREDTQMGVDLQAVASGSLGNVLPAPDTNGKWASRYPHAA